MSLALENEYMRPGRSGVGERRAGPRIEMHGPVARAGEVFAELKDSVEAAARFRRLQALDAAGIGREVTERLRAEVRDSLDVLPGGDVPGGKGLGQGGRRTH